MQKNYHMRQNQNNNMNPNYIQQNEIIQKEPQKELSDEEFLIYYKNKYP